MRKKERSEQSMEICGKKIPRHYPGNGGDIALLELCDPVKFTPTVQPIGIAPIHTDVTGYATVAGWGVTRESGPQSRILRAVKVPIVDQNKCRRAYGFIDKGHICAGDYNTGGRDSCQGDSGGALWWKHPKTHQIYQVLLQIASF